MSWLRNLSLSTRLVLMLLLTLGMSAVLMVLRSESVLEDAMLDHTKQQVKIFLLGQEEKASTLGDVRDANLMQNVLSEAAQLKEDVLGFSVRQLYTYDLSGRVYAWIGGDGEKNRPLDGHYGGVLRQDAPYLGREVEELVDPVTRLKHHVLDVIIPIHRNGKVVGGMEAEINLDATMDLLRQMDNAYEQEITLIVTVSLLLALGLIWLLIRSGIIRPIKSLTSTTQRIAEGDLSTRNEQIHKGEFALLSDSINRMADSIEDLFQEQESAYLQTLQSLAKALEAKDSYTAKHSSRVAKFSVMLGRRLGIDEQQLKLLKQGALMHDLGKIGIADSILNKPDRLTDEEYEIIRNHPDMTATIMRPLKRFKAFAEIAAWHHERWDGGGYPDGLKGEQIPLLARIVSIADTWDAMTGDRVYRKGVPVDKALSILESERDSGQWDPKLVDVFVELIRSEQNARHEVEADMFGTPQVPATLV